MRLTQEDALQQRQLIIRTAHEVFMKKGYAATKIDDIARASDISRSPVYYYFKNKQELFFQVVEYHFELLEEFFTNVFRQDKDIFELFHEEILTMLEASRKNQMFGYISKDINSDVMAQNRELVGKHIKKIIDIKCEAVRRAIDRGQVRADIIPDDMVRIVFVFYSGLEAMQDENNVMHTDAPGKLAEDFIEMLRIQYGAKRTQA